MQRLVAGKDAVGRQSNLSSRQVGDEPAGLTYQRDASGHVPGSKTPFPVAIDAARGNPRQIERSGAKSPQPSHSFLHGRVLVPRKYRIAPTGMGQRAGND